MIFSLCSVIVWKLSLVCARPGVITQWGMAAVPLAACICSLLILFSPAAAITGTDTLLHSANITLVETSPSYMEFSNFFTLNDDSLVWMNTWQEKKYDAPLHKNSIFLMNFTANTTRLVTETPGSDHEHPFRPPVALSARFIAWSEFGTGTLYVYDSLLATQRSVSGDGSNDDEHWENIDPALDGDHLVWSRKRSYPPGHDPEIVLLNLTTGSLKSITKGQGDRGEPSISGSRIVWTDKRNEPGGGDIYLFNLDTGSETAICTEPGLQHTPKIAGTSIVWTDYRNGHPAIYLYDLMSGTELLLSDSFVDAALPKISDEFVVWSESSVMDLRDTQTRWIVVYDISKGQKEIFTLRTRHPWFLDLDKNRILYANPDDCPMEDGYVHLFVIDSRNEIPVSPPSLPVSGQENIINVVDQPERPVPTQSASSCTISLAFASIGLLFCVRDRIRLR